MLAKRWSGLVFGYGLILLVTVMLGALTVPSPALAEGGGAPPEPPLSTDTTCGGSSINDPTIVDPSVGDISTMDLLLLTIDSIMML